MPIANLAEAEFYYELHGPPEAPPLLLIHGAMETFQRTWRKQIPLFSQTFRVIGPDLRGHGRSTNPARQLDLRQLADDMAQLLTYLGYEKAHVCGFSGGAATALFMGARHLSRLTSVTLISSNFELDQVRTQSSFWDPERIAREEPQWWQAIEKLHQINPKKLLRWWAEEDVIRPNFHPLEIGLLDVPALVMGGDRDPIVPLSQTVRLFELLPRAQLCILPGVGHGIPSRRPDLFNQILLEFIDSLE